MLELPEVLSRARELNAALNGKTISNVLPPSSPHKFCWFTVPLEECAAKLNGHAFQKAEGFGIYVEMDFGGIFLCINDGVNLRLLSPEEKRPAKHQLLVEFDDGFALFFSVAMYGGICLHDGNWDNEYYRMSRERISPLSDAFTLQSFDSLIASVKSTASVKALLATQQRIPGLGNGTLQDILLNARIHPKRKISTLTAAEKNTLYASIRSTLSAMTEQGGRDTERTIRGNPGGYKTLLSKNTLSTGCPICGSQICKETYMGGAIYYCPTEVIN